MRRRLVLLENHFAFVLLVFHEFNRLPFNAIGRQGYLSAFEKEGRYVPLILPVIVARLVLQRAEGLLLHKHVNEVPIKLDVQILLSQRVQNVFLFLLMLTL